MNEVSQPAGLHLSRARNSPFTVVCTVAKPLNRSEAKVDLVMVQTLLLFKYNLLCYLDTGFYHIKVTQPHSKSKNWQLYTQL